MADLFVKIGADLTQFSTSMQNMERQLMKSGRKMQAMGRNMSQAFTLPLVAIAGLSVKSFAKFDSAMTQSLAIMNGVTPEIRKQMEGVAKTVSKDLGIATEDSAKSFFYLASAGLDAAQSMEALPIVAKFAKAGMFDMALATDLATDAQSALGLTTKDAAKNTENLITVTDTLVKANTLANATVEQFSSALTNKAGASLKMVGKSIQEGTAVLAAFADQGIKGEEAGTQLGIVLRDLQTKAIQNEGAFKRAGVSVFDANGKMNNMADIVGDLEGLLGGMSDKQKKATLLMMGFSDKSIAATQALLGTSDKIRMYQKELESATGFTDQVAGKQMLSFSEQINKLKAELEVLATDIAPIVIDGFIKPLMSGIQKLADWFGSLTDGQKKMIVQIAGVVAAIGPALFIIGKMQSAIGGLVGTMAKLANPIGIIIGLVALVSVHILEYRKHLQATTVDTGRFVKAVQSERSEIDFLFNSLKDTNTSYADRTEAIKTINKKYGEYLPNLLTEKSSLKEIENAQNLVTIAIIKKVALMSREKEITEASTKAIEENRKAADKITKLITKSKGELASGAAGAEIQNLIELNAKMNEQIKKTGKESASTAAAQSKLGKAQKDFAKKYGLTVNQFNRLLTTAGAASNEQIESIQKIDNYFKGYIGTLESGTSAVKQFSQAELDMFDKEIKYLSEIEKRDANQDRQLREAISKRNALLALKKEQVNVDEEVVESTEEETNVIKDLNTEIKKATLSDAAFQMQMEELIKTNDKLRQSLEIPTSTGATIDTGKRAQVAKMPSMTTGITEFDIARMSVDELREALIKMERAGGEGTAMWQRLKDEVGKADFAENFAKGIDAAGASLNIFSDLFASAKNKELAAVEGNAKATAAVNAKYAKKEQSVAIVGAIINTAQGITKALAQGGMWGIMMGAIVAAAGAAQISLIKSQQIPSFAEGGMVTSPQLAMIGDNPGRREAIIPSELFGKIGGSSEQQVFIPNMKISGSDMLIVFDRAQRKKSKVT